MKTKCNEIYEVIYKVQCLTMDTLMHPLKDRRQRYLTLIMQAAERMIIKIASDKISKAINP